MSDKPVLLFICSPSLGILDNWLPVLWNLKRRRADLEFIILFPQNRSIRMIKASDTTIRLGEKIFDRVIYKSVGKYWIVANSIKEVQENATDAVLIRVLERLATTKFISPLAKFSLNIFSWYKIKVKKMVGFLTLSNYNKNISAICYDISEEWKQYFNEIASSYSKVPKFSLCHGINVNDHIILEKEKSIRNRDEVTAYLYSEKEKSAYIENYHLRDDQLKVVGIPRHNKWWIEKIIQFNTPCEELEVFAPYIFIISRPGSTDFFTKEKKKKALQEIKKIAQSDLNAKLVVKLHPKERKDGLYEEVLGENSYGKEWIYTTKHPFAVGKFSLFSICFLSGVSIDMIALGIPTIEHINLTDYDANKSEVLFFDKQGKAITGYRKYGLVLGSDDYYDLKQWAVSLKSDRGALVQQLKKQYATIFPLPQNSVDMITEDICKII